MQTIVQASRERSEVKDNRFETPNPHNISFNFKTGAKDKDGSISKAPKNNVLEGIEIS